MNKKIASSILFLILMQEISFSQTYIEGETSVCQNEIYEYEFRHQCSTLNIGWIIEGGEIMEEEYDPIVKVRWTSIGPKSLRAHVSTTGCPDGDPRPDAEVDINFKQAPAVSLSTFSQNIVCTDESITLNCNNTDITYFKDWMYSTSPNTDYSTFKTTTTPSTTVHFNDDLPAGLIDTKLYFRVRLRPCSDNLIGSTLSGNDNITFHRAIPSIFDIDTSPPSYSCTSDGKVSISNLKYSDGSNYNGEPIIIAIENAGGTRGYSQIHSGALSYTITDDFLTTENGYRLKIENAVEIGENTCATEGYEFTIPPPASFVANNPIVSKNISCHNSSTTGNSTDGEIKVTVNDGKPPFNYYLKKDGETFVLEQSNRTSRSYIYQNLGAGVYEVRIIDSCGDEVNPPETITLTEPPPLIFDGSETKVISDYNGSAISCHDSSDGIINISADGGTGDLLFSVDGGTTYQNSNEFLNLSADNYVTQIKDENSCELTGPGFTIDQPDEVLIDGIIPIQNNGYNVKCSGGSDGLISIEAVGGTGQYQYYVDGSEYAFTPTLSEGSHIIIVKDLNGCPSDEQSIILTAPPAIDMSVNITSDFDGQHLSCYEAADGEITISASGGAGNLEYSVDNGINFYTTSVFTNLSSGTYLIKVRDINGCVVESSPVTINDPPGMNIAETISDYNGMQISCSGAMDGSIELNVTGGSGNFTYNWSNGAIIKDLNNLSGGNYTVIITDSHGCQQQETYALKEPFPLLADAIVSDFNGTGVSCSGGADGAIDLDLSGGTAPYNYSWSTGESGQDISALSAGNYSVMITDANGCSRNINNIAVTEPMELSLTITNKDNIDCHGNSTGSITLAASGGVGSYEYTMNGSEWQTENIFTALSAGNYDIDLRDANGCSSSTSTTITEPALLDGTVVSVTEASCGESNGSAIVTASGGMGNYTFTWHNGFDEIVGNEAVLDGVPGGIYTVTITDINGCSINRNANVSSEDGAEIIASNLVGTSCFNSNDGRASLQLNGAGPFHVSWNNGESGIDPTNLYPGENVVSITDANECVVVKIIDVPHPNPIDYAFATNVAPTCFDSQDGSLQINAFGGAEDFSYQWKMGSTDNYLNDISQGDYAVVITDGNGCVLNTSVHLDGVTEMGVNVVNVQAPTCIGDNDGSISLNCHGGNGGYNYQWFDGSSSANHTDLSSGDYDITVTDSKGCSLLTVVEIPEAESFSVAIDDETICSGSTYAVNAPEGNKEYLWESNNGFSSADRQVMLTEAGDYKLTVINQEGCVAEDSFELNISNDLLEADFLMISEAYVGDTVVLIDISWPIPETLAWDFGDSVEVLMENKDYAEVVFNEPGIYTINISAGLADCSDYYSQPIHIIEKKKDENTGGKMASDTELVSAFKVYPNPNDGHFWVTVDLSRKENIHLMMVDLSGNKIILDESFTDKDFYEVEINLSGISPGIYLLRLDVGGTSKIKRLLIE